MMGLKVLLVLSLCLVLASCTVLNLEISKDTDLCSSTQDVTKDQEVTVIGKGSIPGADCSIMFKSGECGICFQFENYAYFNTSLARIVLTAGSISKIIDTNEDFPPMYTCSDESSMSLTVEHDTGYVYDPKEPGYRFVLDVYNKCGYRGTAKSVPFSEVVKHAKGYHHGEEKDDREISTLVTGLVVGLCLACMFLIVLLIAYCYVKNSPNRGASKSAGMPKVGGKRTMDPSAPRSAPKSDVEMVAYKKDGNRVEGKPLLTGAAAAVVLSKEDKKTKKRDRKNSSGSSSSNSSHGNNDVEADEKKELIQPTVAITSEPSAPSESHTTSGGGDSGVGGGSSDYTSGGGGGGSSDHTSSYGGGGGFSDYSSGGGGGGGSCGGGGGGGGSCGGGGGGDD